MLAEEVATEDIKFSASTVCGTRCQQNILITLIHFSPSTTSTMKFTFLDGEKKIHIAFGSVRTDLTEEGANSTLSVAKINKSDSGEKLQDLN